MSTALTLQDAIVAYLKADAEVNQALGGRISGDDANRDTVLPYCVIYQRVAGGRRTIGTPKETVVFEVAFVVLHTSKAAAFTIAWMIRDLLVGTATRPAQTLYFVSGRDISRLPTNDDALELDEQRGPGGVDVWRYTLPIHWTIARG